MQIQAKCEASSVAPNVAFMTMVMSEVGEQVFGRKPNLVRKKKRVKVTHVSAVVTGNPIFFAKRKGKKFAGIIHGSTVVTGSDHIRIQIAALGARFDKAGTEEKGCVHLFGGRDCRKS
jgi:hypothetical protein